MLSAGAHFTNFSNAAGRRLGYHCLNMFRVKNFVCTRNKIYQAYYRPRIYLAYRHEKSIFIFIMPLSIEMDTHSINSYQALGIKEYASTDEKRKLNI